jgi:hypothetical protein
MGLPTRSRIGLFVFVFGPPKKKPDGTEGKRKMDEMRTESTWCVSSNPEATAAALTKLAGDVSEFCTTMPDVTLEVSGADGDAAAKKLQGIVANVTVTKASAAKAGTLVVAKKKGTPVAQFHSTTTIVPTIVPVVHTPTGGGDE